MWNWLDTPKELDMEISTGVANSFIQRGIDNNTPLTRWKLQLLVFVAHGWYLAVNNEPLVDETFIATNKGPILPYVNSKFSKFGDSPITSLGIDSVLDKNDNIKRIALLAEDDEAVTSVINQVWKQYGDKTEKELFDHMLAAKNFPWTYVWQKQSNYGRGDTTISDSLIFDYFRPMLCR